MSKHTNGALKKKSSPKRMIYTSNWQIKTDLAMVDDVRQAITKGLFQRGAKIVQLKEIYG